MGLIYVLTGFFVIKGVFLWVIYHRNKLWPLLIGLITSLAIAPLLTVLYHETDIDFWLVYLLIIILDCCLYIFILGSQKWKAILTSLLLNTIAFVYFLLGNG